MKTPESAVAADQLQDATQAVQEQVFSLFGAIGTAAEDAARSMVRMLVAEPSLFPTIEPVFGLPPSAPPYLEQLTRVGNAFLEPRWSEHAVAEVLIGIATYYRERKSFTPDNLADVQRWIRAHEPDDCKSVLDCVTAYPPRGFEIHRVLSRAGSQKLVFRSSLVDGSREVVLKKLSGDPAQTKVIEERERLASPLRNKHENIIETYFEHNTEGSLFIVERLLPDVLNDDSRSHGTERAGQLLFDISSAVAYLHSRNLVHGDIKPDNIGVDDRRYILLDFGICRPPNEFTGGTGSLRTQAPELLLDQGPNSFSSDIWALGATVLNYLGIGFPLLEENEAPPKAEPQRAAFREVLVERAALANSLVADKLAAVEDIPLRAVLQHMLETRPEARISADAVVREMRERLPQIVGGRGSDTPGPQLDPRQHCVLLLRNFPPTETLPFLSPFRRDELRETLRRLRESLAPDDPLRQRLSESLSLVEQSS